MVKRIIISGLVSVGLLFAPAAYAGGAVVVEGDFAKGLYDKEKGSAQTLMQVDKEFILQAADGTKTEKPEEMTVKVGERFFITNDEEKFVHNVYDTSDSTWVLQKQEPTAVAAVTFEDPGEHKLRCAIHPKMKITVKVVP